MPYPMTPATRAFSKPRLSNWGTGVEPVRRTTAQINAEQDAANQLARGPSAPQSSGAAPAYTPRKFGTMTSADLNRSPDGSLLGVRPGLPGAPVTSGYTEYSAGGRPAATAAARVSPAAPRPMSTTPSPAAMEFLRTGIAPNVPDPAPYNPPQQTERANPLTGDSNRAPGGSTTGLARTPFVQRGAGVPQGQDAIPAPVQETESEDATIGGSMQGTMNRLRGTTQANPFARRFGQPSKQSAYDSYLRRVMPT